ncbi:legume lectin domain containing protein [Grosmannia clavigera kw1407]|uniref:Legume lectin domain containing protein n=1 Tax=Grosmannia clavigera (strain kw1407 / UAMH 11150) TaxID=655863 RepID=F0XJM3_GROCL|nr:legume lectin domain containing protein [Grosmannia clavigera kw1407]EFX02197.1 legume lectin domain containing protein [Grosmannia clavigera kw1407]
MAVVLVAALSMLVRCANGLASTDTITWGGDNSRTGYQTNHNMDPDVVGSDDFTQLFKTALPGNYGGYTEQIFSQPLVYTPSDETTQYVYFATTQNNVYKLNAVTGKIVASTNLAIPFLTADLDGCVDINPTIGVTSTGVIDPDTDTLYLTSKTYANQSAINVAQGRPAGRYHIHALDVHDLSERANFPIDLEGLAANNNPVRTFNGGIQHQRPALLHSGQYIYAGFASHCVQYNFTGWLMGWDKTTGAIVENWATEGAGVPNTTPGGGIWMSGGGLASDDSGSMFFGTGNGYASQLSTIPVQGRNPPTSLEEAAVHMTMNDDGSLSIIDFFMPQEKQALDGADKDLGTSPLELLPSEFSCGDITHMGVITGKSGKTYFLNLDDLGGYRTGTDDGDNVIQVYQNENSVYAGAGVYPLEGGYIYINVIKYPTHVFKFSCDNGVPSFVKVADSPENNAYTLGVSHGTVTSLDGQEGTGLLWTCDVQGNNLRIYNAVPDGDLLTEIKSFSVPGTTKFTRAVFGDGRVYMGTTQGYVYGFGGPVNEALNCTTPSFGSLDIASAAKTATVTCTAVTGTSITKFALNSTDFSISNLPTVPKTLAVGDTFTFTASFQPTEVGFLSDSVLITTDNSATGYTSKTSVRLTGTATSSGPLLGLSPKTLTFTNVVVGANPGGVTEPVVLSNNGNSTLTITGVQYSQTSATGPFEQPSGNGSDIGPYSISGIPSTIAANGGTTIDINFDPTTGGNSSLFIVFGSDGGSQTLSVNGNAGSGPVWLMEFQTPDGSGWVTYEKNQNFTFGNVTENNSRTLKFRVTNSGSADAVPLSITVSKPPFGVSGIIGAVNDADLVEGTILKAGESQTASLYCSVPKEQWNSDAYWGAANWTMNTNDPDTTKQYIQFSCLAVSEQAPPLQADGDSAYRYLGCYKDNNPDRQLTTQLYGNDSNTIAMCIAACAASGYTYCGTEYQRECWAGNTIPSLKVDEDDCNYACSGNNNQICGGNGVGTDAGGSFMSLFALDGASTIPTGSGSSSGPVVNSGIDGYVSIGCYTEPSTARALANQLSTTNETVDDCLNLAAASNYVYAGLEYGGECWVGNSLNSGANSTILASCSMTCNGNSSEYCGGPSLLNIYRRNSTTLPTSTSSASPSFATGPVTNPGEDGYTFLGCYQEPSNSRALSNQLTVTNQTVGVCLALAAAKGYTYAGLEYGGECWCDNTLSPNATLESTSACTMTCNGNSTEYCGGSSLLDVYKTNSTTAATTLGTPTQVAVATTPASTGPIINPGLKGYAFLGCYHEPSGSRAFSNQLTVTNETVANCLDLAYSAGYIYAGLEYGGECWCGNSISVNATLEASSACAMTCNGNSSEYCGGSSLLEVYKTNKMATLTTATTATTATTSKATAAAITGPVINPGLDGYSFLGCYKEPSTSRAFSQQLTVTNETVANCLQLAAAAGYTYAGLEYGGECWCGNTISPNATLQASSACTMTCNGNTTEYCGGSSLLDVYELSTATTSPLTAATPTSAASGKVAGPLAIVASATTPSTAATIGSNSTAATIGSNSTTAAAATLPSATSPSTSVSSTATTSDTTAASNSTIATTSSLTALSASTSGKKSANTTVATATTLSSVSATTLITTTSANSTLSRTAPNIVSSSSSSSTSSSSSILSSSSTSSLISSSTLNSTSSSTSSLSSSPGSSSTPSSTFSSTFSSTSSGRTSSSSPSSSGSPSTPSSPSAFNSSSSSTSVSSSSASTSSTPTSSSANVSPTVELPEAKTLVGNYSYVGCYSEPKIGYALSSNKTKSINMTQENCADFCGGYSYILFGVENADGCYCGNSLSNSSIQVNETKCSSICSGDDRELCGGSAVLNVWSLNVTSSLTLASASTSPTAA